MMIKISETAKIYILDICERSNAIGLSVEAVKGGCSGMQFKFSIEKNTPDYAEEIKIENNIFFFIKQSALLFVVGSTLEYKKTMTGAMLLFQKTNTKGSCGCGKSFY